MTALATLPDLLGTSPADLLGDCDRRDSTPDEARQRAERLRAGIVRYSEMRQDIADAYACRDWLALGYDNWPAYVEAEFGEQLAQLGRGERRQAVADLRSQGMSTRQIADVTGISKGTVGNDLAQVPNVGHLPEKVTGSDGKQHPAKRPERPPFPGPTGAEHRPPADPGATPALAASESPVLAAPRESAPAPGPAVAPSTAPVGPGSGEEVAPAREGAGGTAEPEAERYQFTCFGCGKPFVATISENRCPKCGGSGTNCQPLNTEPAPAAPTTLRLDPTEDEKRAAVQRDARRLLLRVVEILDPAHDRPGFVETWARQLGPYDEELQGLIRRAHNAMASLDDLISEAGQAISRGGAA